MSFSKEVSVACDGFLEDTQDVSRLASIEVFRRAIVTSPVGNPKIWVAKKADGTYTNFLDVRDPPAGYTGGSFRNNWKLTAGTAPDPSRHEADKAGTKSLQQLSAIQSTDSDEWWLTNMLPYAERLEEGWSTQAANGIIGPLVEKWSGIVKKIANQVGL